MSTRVLAEEEIVLIESEEEETESGSDETDSAYSSDEKNNNNDNYTATTQIDSSSNISNMVMKSIDKDTSQFQKELKSTKNNFFSKVLKNGNNNNNINRSNTGTSRNNEKNKFSKKNPLETKSMRDSVHLTHFKIDEEDIIDFGKPLTSTTTSANINIQSKNNPTTAIGFHEEILEIEEEEVNRRNAVSSRDDDLIKLEDSTEDVPKSAESTDEHGIVIENPQQHVESTIKEEIKKELSFYQKWFNFYRNEESPSLANAKTTDQTTEETTPRPSEVTNTTNTAKTQEQQQSLPVYKIAILGEDLSDSLIAAEFIQEEFKKSTVSSEESIMKKQFNFGGKPYQLELFFYDMYEQFVNMMDQCLKECDGFLLVYNVASRRSFQQVDILYEKLYRAKDGGTISMVLVGIEYTNKTNAGSPPSTTSLLLRQHSTTTPLTYQPSPLSSASYVHNGSSNSNSGVMMENIGPIQKSSTSTMDEDVRKSSIASQSSATKYWNTNNSMTASTNNKQHSFIGGGAGAGGFPYRTTSFVTSQNGKERQVSKREGLKKSLYYYVPFIEMNSDEPKTLIQQKVKEIFQNLLREIIQGGNLRYSAVKPQTLTNAQYLTSQLGSATGWNESEKSDVVLTSDIPPNQDSVNIVMNSVKALFTNLNVHGYCLNTPINDEKELQQIEFLIDNFESYQVSCQVIEICLKRFDFRNVKLKLKQKVTPHNEQQILSFLFDIPLKKKNILQMMFTKSDENYQKEINERLIFAIFIATFAKQLYSEQNQQLYDGTFMVSLEDEWNFILNLKNLFETVKKKVKEYSTLEDLVEDQVVRMVDWMEKKIHLKRGNEIELLMKFLLQHVTSPMDCYGFERRVRPHVLGNRYLILKRIFSNNHSKIYKSVKVKTNSICALKHLTNFTKSDLTEVGKGVESMIMFPKHENVMTFTDYTVRRCRSDRYEIFIEFPYMNGSNMEKRVEFMIKNNKCMNYLELIDIYLQSTKGLQHLHQNSIVFPSLKLEKLLMNYNTEDTKEIGVATPQKLTPLFNVNTPVGEPSVSSNSLFEQSSSGRGNVGEGQNGGKQGELKSVIIKAFDENDTLLGNQYKSNLNVKLTDFFKPWDFSILDGTVQFKNRQVMEQFHSKNQQLNEWSTIRSTTPTSTTSSNHSTLRKQMVLHEIMSSNTIHHDRLHFDGDIERYLDEKDDIFRLGCIFYQLATKESFIRWSGLFHTQLQNPHTASSDSTVSTPTTSTTSTVIHVKRTEISEENPEEQNHDNSTGVTGIHIGGVSNNQHFDYISIEEAISRDEKLTHQLIASKIHMSLLKSEAIPHNLSTPRVNNNHNNNSSNNTGVMNGLASEASSPMSAASIISSPPENSAERIAIPPSTSNTGGNSGGGGGSSSSSTTLNNNSLNHHRHHETDELSSSKDHSKGQLYHCSQNNEHLLIGLIQQMLRINPNQRPTLKKIILILEVLMKYNQVDLDTVDTLLSK